MLNLVKCHQVSLVENLFESFTKLTEHHLMANVHAEKILEVFQHFIAIHDEPLFFILELPVSSDREKVIAWYTTAPTKTEKTDNKTRLD